MTFFFSLILYFWKSNLYSRFLIFAFWYLLSILYPIFSTHFYLGARLLAWLLSPPLDSPFSPPGRLCLLPPPSLLYPTLWISVCSRLWRTLRELITGWICLSPFDSLLLSSWPLLSLPASSLLCITPWTSLSGPDCGVHIRKCDYWLACCLLFWFHLISFGSPLTPSSFFSSPCNSVNFSGCTSLWRIFSSLT